MSNIERIGISVETDLLGEFDAFIAGKGYPNRSEAIRDLIRSALSQEQLQNPESWAVAGIFLVYDHHTAGLNQKLNDMQHSQFYHVIASTHVHLDHHNCLEIIILKGKTGEIQRLADGLTSIKGVKISTVNMMAVQPEDHPHSQTP
ncbi:MAG: nickel-responsive transcriptional regulator NikR [Sedimentisphaerales bacterium]|nr:nickel-responsive transcriptional regulator NikR [Sedimentisphaerales bacterium]